MYIIDGTSPLKQEYVQKVPREHKQIKTKIIQKTKLQKIVNSELFNNLCFVGSLLIIVFWYFILA